MSRCLPWLVLAACGTAPGASAVTAGDDDAPALRSHTAAAVEPPPAPVPPPRPYETAPLPIAPAAALIAATPQGEITIAAPFDGGYAVSADRAGGVRLWPALDGTREPIVIRARHARQIATLRDGEAIVIAVVDSLGQLELLRVTADGTPLDRVAVAVPRPIVEVVASAHDLVLLRDDHVLGVLDARGTIRGELEPAPGEQIARLIAASDRVLAVLAPRAGKRTARWLALGEHVAWGARTARFACDDADLYLSPDGKSLLATAGTGTAIVLVDLVRGTTTEIERSTGSDPHLLHTFGFRAADRPVFTRDGRIQEWVDDTIVDAGAQVDARWLATERGGIGAAGEMLVLQRGDAAPTFLGYRAGELADLVPAKAGGWVATDGATLFHLDAKLRTDRELTTPFPEPERWVQTLTLIDERHVVIAHDQMRFLYELGRESATLMPSEGYGFEFERSTGLALIPTDQRVLHWNAAKRAFDPDPIVLSDDGYAVVRLYNPAGNRGMVAVTISEGLDDPARDQRMARIRRREILAVGVRERHRDVTFLAPFDDIFEHHSGPNLDQFLPEAVAWAASSDGSLIAEIGSGRITLHDADGNVRWERTADGATRLAWNGDDELVVFGPGAALVDLETGELRVRQCGWRFGLWSQLSETVSLARICEAP